MWINYSNECLSNEFWRMIYSFFCPECHGEYGHSKTTKIQECKKEINGLEGWFSNLLKVWNTYYQMPFRNTASWSAL